MSHAETAPPLCRSLLYLPAANARALQKARGLPADGLILDLEDAVAPDAKADARASLRAALDEGGFGERLLIARINDLSSPWGRDDAEALRDAPADAFLLPKVSGAADVDALLDIIGTRPVWAMIETPAGVQNAAEIAAHPQVQGFVAGTNDLAKELNCRFRADRLPLMGALQAMVLAARGAGVLVVDGVYNQFKDEAGLEAEAEQGRDLGFDGKSLIHPAQLAVANRVFSPAPDEIDLAERQIAAFEAAEAEGRGIAVLDGRIVENLHVETARRTLAQARAIAAREAEADAAELGEGAA